MQAPAWHHRPARSYSDAEVPQLQRVGQSEPIIGSKEKRSKKEEPALLMSYSTTCHAWATPNAS
jgi:hypothetical protein